MTAAPAMMHRIARPPKRNHPKYMPARYPWSAVAAAVESSAWYSAIRRSSSARAREEKNDEFANPRAIASSTPRPEAQFLRRGTTSASAGSAAPSSECAATAVRTLEPLLSCPDGRRHRSAEGPGFAAAIAVRSRCAEHRAVDRLHDCSRQVALQVCREPAATGPLGEGFKAGRRLSPSSSSVSSPRPWPR